MSSAIETLKKVTYENLDQFLEVINRNFAVIQNSPLYKGIPGDPGIDAVGAAGIRGSQFLFVKLENFNAQFPGEISTASKINIDFINAKLTNFDSKQKLIKALGIAEFVNNDIIVLSNSMMLSYSIIDDKFIDTGIAFNEQSNLAGNIELKIEQYVKYYIENNSAIANVQNIFSGFTTYAKNYTDNNGSYITKSLTNSSVYAPYIPGYSSTIGIKLTNHKYFGFNDTEYPKDNDGTMVFGSMKRYFDLLMNTISTAGSETLSSDYAPGVGNIPIAVFMQDTYNNGLLFGYKGKTNLKRFGSIYKNENDELIIKSDSSKNDSEFSSIILHRDYLRYKKLVQFYDSLEVSRDLSVFGNITNKFLRTGSYTASKHAECAEVGSTAAGSRVILSSETIQYLAYKNKVLVTDADGSTVKDYVVELSYNDEGQIAALSPVTDNKNSAFSFITSKHYGFIARKINAITSWILQNVWRKDQFPTGEIPDLKLSGNLSVGNNITNDLINTDKTNNTITTGKTGSTHIEKSNSYRLEAFGGKVLVTDGAGNVLKTYSIETLNFAGTNALDTIQNIAASASTIPTAQHTGFLANKINAIVSWIIANVWRKDQFPTGEIPDLSLSNNLSVGNNITNDLINTDKASGTITTGKTGGMHIEKSTNVKLEQFTNKVLVTDQNGTISKSFSLENATFSSYEESALATATVIPTASTSIVTSNYLGWVIRKLNNLIFWIKNNVYTIANFTDGTIANLRLTQRLTTKHITSDYLSTYDTGANIGVEGKQTTFYGVKNFNIGIKKVFVSDDSGNLSNEYWIDESSWSSNTEEVSMNIPTIYDTTKRITTSSQLAFIIRNINKLKAAVRNVYTKGEIDNMIMAKLPTGVIVIWTQDTIPTGWYECNGTNGTPDLRDRTVQMYGSSIGLRAYAGTNFKTLVQENIPYHKHSLDRNWLVTGFKHTHKYDNGFYEHYANRSGGGGGDHDGHASQYTTGSDSGTYGSAGQYKMKFSTTDRAQTYDESSGDYLEVQSSFNETLGWGGNQAVDPAKQYGEPYNGATGSEIHDWAILKDTIAFDNRPACYGVKFIMKG